MSSIFLVNEQKCLTGYTKGNETLERQFLKLYTFSESVEPLSTNRYPKMTKNVHVCAICCRLEVGYDVIFGLNVKTVVGYVVVNCEVASTCCF